MVGQQARVILSMNLRGLIPLLCGLYCILVAFRIIPASKNPEANELWLRKFGALMKILGPFIFLFGLAELLGLFK